MDELDTSTDPNEKIEPIKAGSGALVGTIIVIILLAIGAYYLWTTRNSANENPPPLILGNDVVDAGPSDTRAGVPPQSVSDEEGAISADIEAMNMSEFESQNTESSQSYEASVR